MIEYIDKRSYFISCTGDRVLNKTKNWDDKLRAYKSFYNDDIFRIRCSSHKERRYFDFWSVALHRQISHLQQ